MDTPKHYVLGFLFDIYGDQVALIHKTRPDWQAGKLNGIGGKIEKDESPSVAMEREFLEETGQPVRNWIQFAKITTVDGDIIYVFSSHSQKIYELRTVTDEMIDVRLVEDLSHNLHLLPNVQWLITMARSFEKGEKARMFEIKECA